MLKDKIKMTGQEISILDNENKLQYLIDLAKDVDVLDQKFKTDDNKIFGCASNLWVVAEKSDGKIFYKHDADAFITKGTAKLVIDKNANLDFIAGNAGFTPIPPETPADTLPLYDIIMGAATLNDSDVFLSKYNSNSNFLLSNVTSSIDKIFVIFPSVSFNFKWKNLLKLNASFGFNFLYQFIPFLDNIIKPFLFSKFLKLLNMYIKESSQHE